MGINKQNGRMNAHVHAPWKSPGCQYSLPKEELKAELWKVWPDDFLMEFIQV